MRTSKKVVAQLRNNVKQRLEYLRGEIRAERISTGEILELQGLAEHIDKNDVELLEWAGVEEFETECEHDFIDADNEGFCGKTECRFCGLKEYK